MSRKEITTEEYLADPERVRAALKEHETVVVRNPDGTVRLTVTIPRHELGCDETCPADVLRARLEVALSDLAAARADLARVVHVEGNNYLAVRTGIVAAFCPDCGGWTDVGETSSPLCRSAMKHALLHGRIVLAIRDTIVLGPGCPMDGSCAIWDEDEAEG